MEADFVHPDYEDLAEGMVTLFSDMEEILNVPELDLDDYQKDLLQELFTLLVYTDYTVFYTPYEVHEETQ